MPSNHMHSQNYNAALEEGEIPESSPDKSLAHEKKNSIKKENYTQEENLPSIAESDNIGGNYDN
jgi:hypothetical protein